MSLSNKVKQVPMDDDDFLNACIEANGQCSREGCTKSIKVVGLKCGLCSNLFCTSHQLPEEHGCGGAAKRAAVTTNKHPQQVKPNADQKKALESKLSKKLNDMQKDRRRKK